jgi:hypothetical protein
MSRVSPHGLRYFMPLGCPWFKSAPCTDRNHHVEPLVISTTAIPGLQDKLSRPPPTIQDSFRRQSTGVLFTPRYFNLP